MANKQLDKRLNAEVQVINVAPILKLVQDARDNALRKVNEELIVLYWKIGEYLSAESEKHSYGDKYIESVANEIKQNYPELRTFTRRTLYRIKQFYETYRDDEIALTPLSTSNRKEIANTSGLNASNKIVSPVATQLDSGNRKEIVSATLTQSNLEKRQESKNSIVSATLTQLNWTNHLQIMSAAKSKAERDFYVLNAIKEKWTYRELRRQLDSAYYQRYVLSANKSVTSSMSKDIANQFLDTYVLDFLDLPENYQEKDLQKQLIENMKNFILEVGKDFVYYGSEVKVQVGDSDFFLDLLFYHRELQCLVAFELKRGKFEPEYIGKMDFYLEALDREHKKEHENPSVGIILCTSANSQVVEYAMSRSISPTLVSRYELALPAKHLLEQRLKELEGIFEE
ncbi:MAG: PDDEXK nuclease domain-containing protein [Bifidobacteriaceae bacterium]|nr:PDDEXK nuclease domain-containing protein [Bifidobacteriaceae bacterium]